MSTSPLTSQSVYPAQFPPPRLAQPLASLPEMADSFSLAPALPPATASTVNSANPANNSDQSIIRAALGQLDKIVNSPQDEAVVRGLGLNPPFHSGREASELIQRKGIQVVFDNMGDSLAHAEWDTEHNRMVLNAKYRGDTKPETIYALSEAIYHEAGHAAGNGDDRSSIQEEGNCLALNAMGYRFHTAQDPTYKARGANSPLISNGVALYSRLFFEDPDPAKQALVNRINLKYGDLPVDSPGHPAPRDPNCLARRVVAIHKPTDNPFSLNASSPMMPMARQVVTASA